MHDNGNIRVIRVLLQQSKRLQAAQSRHHEIEKYTIGPLLTNRLWNFKTTRNLGNLRRQAAQQAPQNVARDLVVIHKEQFQTLAGIWNDMNACGWSFASWLVNTRNYNGKS